MKVFGERLICIMSVKRLCRIEVKNCNLIVTGKCNRQHNECGFKIGSLTQWHMEACGAENSDG